MDEQLAQQQAVDQAARNIMIELNLRQQALERATSSMYEGDAYEVTQTAEVFLQFLQTGTAVAKPTSTGAVTNE
jgi:hypothetical protein